MDKKILTASVFKVLSKEYGSLKPMLRYRDCFQLLISVILSAQTTDEQVNRATPQLFRHYPDAEALSMAEQEHVEQLIHGVGFFRVKARHIIAASRAIHDQYRGNVPSEMEILTRLPGVGRKSANVVRGFCFGKPAIIVDTHFMRVCRRVGLTDSNNPEMIESQVRELLEREKHTRFSMAVNRHGRVCCNARKPECYACSIEGLCSFTGKVTG